MSQGLTFGLAPPLDDLKWPFLALLDPPRGGARMVSYGMGSEDAVREEGGAETLLPTAGGG